MKEMKYETSYCCKILDKGKIKEFKWVILSLGTHPTAYIGLSKSHPYYKKHYDYININCHGGLTFSSETITRELSFINETKKASKDIWWIGWDYTHSGDYTGYLNPQKNLDNKKWTTKEIKTEVISVIKQLDIKKIVANIL